MDDLDLFSYPTRRDVAAADVRRQFGPQLSALERRDPELAALVARLRDSAVRAITREGLACA